MREEEGGGWNQIWEYGLLNETKELNCWEVRQVQNWLNAGFKRLSAFLGQSPLWEKSLAVANQLAPG